MGAKLSRQRAADYTLVMMGATGVGKTATVQRFVLSTEGAETETTTFRFTFPVDDEPAKVDIVDTGQGQKCDLEGLVRESDGFYFMYDITSRESFEDLGRLQKQVLSIRDTQYAPCVVVGNKMDLSDVPYYDFLVLREGGKTTLQTLDEYYVELVMVHLPQALASIVAEQLGDLVDSQQQVRSSEGESVARTWGGTFFETSAKTNDNISLAYAELVRSVRRQRQTLPRPYFRGMTQ